jgi:hypothetical protein
MTLLLWQWIVVFAVFCAFWLRIGIALGKRRRRLQSVTSHS